MYFLRSVYCQTFLIVALDLSGQRHMTRLCIAEHGDGCVLETLGPEQRFLVFENARLAARTDFLLGAGLLGDTLLADTLLPDAAATASAANAGVYANAAAANARPLLTTRCRSFMIDPFEVGENNVLVF